MAAVVYVSMCTVHHLWLLAVTSLVRALVVVACSLYSGSLLWCLLQPTKHSSLHVQIYDSMTKPAFIFDGRNLLDHAKLREIGFIVYALGKPLDPFMQRQYN